jgi:chondroitin AC lyase
MKNTTRLFLILFGVFQSGYSAPSDFETIKKRVTDELMSSAVKDSQVESLINSIRSDGTWPGIDYADVSREGFQHTRHYGNMVTLARAYKTKSSKYFKSKKVKTAIESALKNWVDNDYSCDNWWHNQIGTPDGIVTLMLIVGNELPKDLVDKAQPIIGRAHIDAPGARPGGDRIKIAGIQAKNTLFLGDKETFDKVIRVIESEIKFSEWVGTVYGYGFRHIPSGFENRDMGGRGIQHDYSFHHRVDGVNNTLSYGVGYASAFTEWATYVRGTEYAFAEEPIQRLVDYYLDGISKHLIYGKYPDPGAQNRDISRAGSLRPFRANVAEKLLLTTDYRKAELQEIADIRNKSIKPTLSHATFYWDTEHFTYQRPDWFTSVRMYSTRTHNMEVGYNSEGLLNHHRGDGANHISVTGDEYYDIAPVFDYQKVPGATIVEKAALPDPDEIQKLGLTDFVGAVTDGKYGTAVFDFRSPHDPLIARKSWFFFDNEYVCLGTGISSRRNLPVATTLNQCLLRDDVTISEAGKKSIIEKGEKEFENVDWVFQDGIGYIFPDPATVNIKNSEATGSWWRINKQSDSPKDEIKKDVFKLWLSHGNRPSEATYAYIIAPATSVEKLEEGTARQNITILSNTPEVQAVRHNSLKMVQVVFYKAGEVVLANGLTLKAASPGIFVIKSANGGISEISVADPSRKLGSVHFSLSTRIEKQGENYRTFWNEEKKASEISIDLPQHNYTGSSVTISF